MQGWLSKTRSTGRSETTPHTQRTTWSRIGVRTFDRWTCAAEQAANPDEDDTSIESDPAA